MMSRTVVFFISLDLLNLRQSRPSTPADTRVVIIARQGFEMVNSNLIYSPVHISFLLYYQPCPIYNPQLPYCHLSIINSINYLIRNLTKLLSLKLTIITSNNTHFNPKHQNHYHLLGHNFLLQILHNIPHYYLDTISFIFYSEISLLLPKFCYFSSFHIQLSLLFYNSSILQSRLMLPALHNDNAYFHQNRRSRLNPTFVSTLMTDSLTNLTPQSFYKKANKQTEYKQNFQPSNDQNKISIHGIAKSSNFAKFTRQSFEKNRSTLSNYGANILGQSNKSQY